MALGALALALSRAVVLFVLASVGAADAGGRWPIADFLATEFGRASLIGTALALGLAALAARRGPGPPTGGPGSAPPRSASSCSPTPLGSPTR